MASVKKGKQNHVFVYLYCKAPFLGIDVQNSLPTELMMGHKFDPEIMHSNTTVLQHVLPL